MDYRIINNIEDQIALQQDLIRLELWATSWGMVFNPSKCYMMHIGRGRNTQTHMYELCGTVLGCITIEKDLGVYLNHDLKWDHHIDKMGSPHLLVYYTGRVPVDIMSGVELVFRQIQRTVSHRNRLLMLCDACSKFSA